MLMHRPVSDETPEELLLTTDWFGSCGELARAAQALWPGRAVWPECARTVGKIVVRRNVVAAP